MSKLKKMSIIITVPILLLVASFASYSYLYAERIYPNTTIANINVGGLSRAEASKALSYQIDLVKNQEIELSYQNKILTIKPSQLDLNYDLEKSLGSAYSYGRSGSLWQKILERSESLWQKNHLQVAFQINKTKLDQTISNLAEEINIPVKNASLEIKNDNILITDSQIGYFLQEDQLRNSLISVIGNLKESRNINLSIKTIQPQLTSNDVDEAANDLQKLVSKSITLDSSAKKFTLSKNEIIKWIELVAEPTDSSKTKFELQIVFNEEKIKAYVSDLAKQIDCDPVDARLTTDNGNIKVFSISQKGFQLDQDQALKTIVANLTISGYVAGISSDQLGTIESDSSLINLPVTTIDPTISENNIADLGIKELISQGSTSYAGSPVNRKYNIKVGAEMFNGVIIKSGEEFSFLKYLGSVSEERGFKKELVIKQDSTEPEVGGGLCQVSTTMFRAALNSGLKITERQNHKYRVSYYEPPVGLDATIYEPSPDLKFLNDTLGSILIQAEIKNDNKLTFYFYGTKDGREVSISEPQLYDYVSPPDPEYIDDPSLPQGEEKYKEKAHTGVKATVNYVVKKNGEVINQQTFNSKYTAWGAVILRGTGPAPAPEETPTT